MTQGELKKKVAAALRLQKRANDLAEKLKDAKDELMPEFKHLAGEKQSAQFACSEGLAEFSRSDSVRVLKEHEAEIKELLGSEFQDFFSDIHNIRGKARPIKGLLADGDSQIGRKLRQFVTIDSREALVFKPN